PQFEYTTPKNKAEQVESVPIPQNRWIKMGKFTKDIENRICTWNTDTEQPITNEKSLNKKWHKLNLAIKEAAIPHIQPNCNQPPQSIDQHKQTTQISTIHAISTLQTTHHYGNR
ncbi:31991_t:CDS:2, partial [Gigaspora margarita]